jgi:hypothetical protein
MTSGVPDMTPGVPEMASGVPDMTSGIPDMTSGIPEMASGIPDMTSGIPEMASGVPDMTSGVPEMPPLFCFKHNMKRVDKDATTNQPPTPHNQDIRLKTKNHCFQNQRLPPYYRCRC